MTTYTITMTNRNRGKWHISHEGTALCGRRAPHHLNRDDNRPAAELAKEWAHAPWLCDLCHRRATAQ